MVNYSLLQPYPLSLVATSFAFATMASDTAIASAATTSSQSATITQSKANSIFKAKLPSNAVIKYMRLTRDDGRKVYKGKAVKGNYVYSIEINASTGKVRDYERDYEGSKYTASKVGSVSKNTIKSKVLKKVSGATIIYIKLTRDDGRYVYEGEAYKNGYEYEFEYTKRGVLIEWDKDRV